MHKGSDSMNGWVSKAGLLSCTLAVGLAVGVVLETVGPSFAGTADNEMLQRLVGEWRGNGRVRKSPDAERERVSCRMTATWDSSSERLSMDYDCRGTDFEFSSSGFLSSLDRNSYITGQWRAGGYGQASVSGRRTGTSLELELTTNDTRTGEDTLSSLSMELSGEGGQLTNTITSENRATRQPYTILSLTLSK